MLSMNLFRRGVSRVLAIGAITSLSAGALPAQAQQQPAQQQAAGAEVLQEVVVTGSIIKRTDFETPSPVQVVTAQDLQESGYTSVSEVLRNLAANGQGTLSQSFGLAFAGGGSGVALRGLTVGGTLTLIDSERMIPYPLSDDGQRNFVDVSTIPFNVIESVEVLKDGASAQYGSDAVAGVLNIKLKKSFTGFTATAETGLTQQGDGFTDHVAMLGGIGDLANDGYNAYLAFEVRHQDSILLNNRSGLWTNLNWTAYGGYDDRYGSPNSPPGSSIFPAIQGGYVLNPATNAFDATSAFVKPYGNCTGFGAFQAGNCIYNPGFEIQPQSGNLNLLGKLTKNLGGDWQASVTASLFRSLSEQVGGNNAAYPFLNGVNPVTLIAAGPGFNPTFVTSPAIMLPVGAPNNPFAAPAALVADFPQLGMEQAQFVTNTYRLFADVRGTTAGWDVDFTAGYMYAALTQTIEGQLNPGMLATAAADGFNFATATADEMRNAFAPNAEVKDTNTMQVVDLHASRELMELPGGPLALAFGVGGYHLYKNSPAPESIQDGLQFGNNAFAIGGQSDDNLYVELDGNPVHGLEIDLSGRYDHYPQYGSSTTPKLGLKWTPIKMVTLRGTYGKGFRAPNPAESGKAGALFGGAAFNDSTLCPNPGTPTAAGNFPSQCNLGLVGLQVSSPTLQPEKSTNWTAGLIFQPLDNTSISFDYWDVKINQDIQSGVTVLFLCSTPAAAALPVCQNPNLFPIVRGPQISLPFCTANGVCNTNELTPIGPVLYQAFPYFNLSETDVKGLDIDLSTHWDLGNAGKLTGSFNYTHIFHYIFGLAGATVDLAGTHGPQIISGDTGNPKDRATVALTWDQGPLSVTASANYTGTYTLIDPTSGLNDCATGIGFGGLGGPQDSRFPAGADVSSLYQYCSVKHFTAVDLYAQYTLNKSWSVHGSILNAFNTTPPVDMQTYGASGGDPYNPAMAQAGAVGRFFMVGATFKY